MKTLSQIERENLASLELLDEATARQLLSLLSYMRGYGVNEYDCVQIERDLIAIVAEARRRGETIDDALGGDKKAFCGQLIENARRQTRLERIGVLMQPNLGFLLFSVLLFFTPPLGQLLDFDPGYMAPVTGGRLFFLLAIHTGFFLCHGYARRLSLWGYRKKLLWSVAAFGLYAFVINIPTLFRFEEAVWFHVHYLVAVLTTAALFFAATIIRYKNARPEWNAAPADDTERSERK